jgi:hypothetical protein
LNTNDPTFLIRRGENLDLIVFSNKVDIKHKTAFLKKSIDVFYGGNSKLHFYNKKANTQITCPELTLSFQLKSGQIEVSAAHLNLTYLYSSYFKYEEINPESRLVYGPWVAASDENSKGQSGLKSPIELKKAGSARFSL